MAEPHAMFHFEKLQAWQKAMALADVIYEATRRFPQDERFGLTNQMRRAAVSIASNLAEGTSRHSGPDFAHFIEISAGSLFELVTQSHIANRQQLLPDEQLKGIIGASDELSRMLSGLRHAVASKPRHAEPTKHD
jgi:four helix bundle protein